MILHNAIRALLDSINFKGLAMTTLNIKDLLNQLIRAREDKLRLSSLFSSNSLLIITAFGATACNIGSRDRDGDGESFPVNPPAFSASGEGNIQIGTTIDPTIMTVNPDTMEMEAVTPYAGPIDKSSVEAGEDGAGL